MSLFLQTKTGGPFSPLAGSATMAQKEGQGLQVAEYSLPLLPLLLPASHLIPTGFHWFMCYSVDGEQTDIPIFSVCVAFLTCLLIKCPLFESWVFLLIKQKGIPHTQHRTASFQPWHQPCKQKHSASIYTTGEVSGGIGTGEAGQERLPPFHCATWGHILLNNLWIVGLLGSVTLLSCCERDFVQTSLRQSTRASLRVTQFASSG